MTREKKIMLPVDIRIPGGLQNIQSSQFNFPHVFYDIKYRMRFESHKILPVITVSCGIIQVL